MQVRSSSAAGLAWHHAVARLLKADGLAALALENAVRSFISRHDFLDRTVLDVGCGTMPYRTLFTTKGARYLGADIDGTPDVLMDPSGEIPMADANADFVVSFQVLEHVRNVSAHLATNRRLLRTGGRMFLSTHGVWPYHPHPTDYWRWTRDGLLVTLEDAGFKIERISDLCGPATWIPMFPLLVCKSILGRAWPVLAPLNFGVNVLASAADRLTPAAVRNNNAAIFAVEVVKAT